MKQLIRKSLTKTVLFAMAVCTVALLGTSGVSHADTLASGALYGGSNQTVAVCYIFNAGIRPIAFVSRNIHSQYDGILAIGTRYYDDCGTSLVPGGVCGFSHTIKNQGYSCKVTIKDSTATVRGTMEIRDTNNLVLANSELR